MTVIQELLAQDELDIAAIGKWLDDASAEDRLAAIRGINKGQQARLWEAAPTGTSDLTLDYMVPKSVPPLTEVIHEGHNSLPMFTLFQKRFCRVKGSSDHLAGYNEQAMKWATGPGYFVARKNTDDRGDIAIDYTLLPDEKAEGWPEILPQKARLGRFVYHDMVDILRRVSSHVTIGRAWRQGKVTSNYFLLCRQG